MCPIKIDRILNFEHVRSGDRPQKRLSNLSSIYLSYINGSLTKDGQTERSRGLLLMTSEPKNHRSLINSTPLLSEPTN